MKSNVKGCNPEQVGQGACQPMEVQGLDKTADMAIAGAIRLASSLLHLHFSIAYLCALKQRLPFPYLLA